MSAVQDMIARLDAAKLQAEEEARKRAHEEAVAAWEAEQEAERQKAEAAAAAEKAAAEKAEAEKAKWHVDEGECAADVAARKDAFLRKNKPKTRPKTVIIKDLQTIVVDVGSNNTKVGFAGEDAPRWMFSTVVGRIRSDHLMDLEKHAHISKDFYVGDEAWGFGPVLDVRRTVDRGVITDYEDFGRIMRQVLEEEMHLSKEEIMDSPVFITEVPFNPKANREAMTRALFDNLNVAALYVANTSSLGLFASGRVTGVVVDIGYGVSTSVAIYDGEVLPNTLRRLDVGGKDLDEYMIRLLNERGYRFNEMRHFDQFVVRDIKERLCYVAYDYELEKKKVGGKSIVKSQWAKGGNTVDMDYNVADHGNDMLPGFENKGYPDVLTIGVERFQCAEALFNPRDLLGKDHMIAGVHNMVRETVKQVPMDLVKVMYSNIVLCGGTTQMKGFADRLRKELREITPNSIPINVEDPDNRHLSVWRGGSILASSSSFNYHWISRDEYKEYGPEMIHATK